jgi:hypothetical protein
MILLILSGTIILLNLAFDDLKCVSLRLFSG